MLVQVKKQANFLQVHNQDESNDQFHMHRQHHMNNY